MPAKQTTLAPAAGTASADRAERQRHGGQKGGHRQDLAGNFDDLSAQASASDSAEYIAVLANQLQRIAKTNGHEFLAYLIDMVFVEAWRIAGPDADHPDTNANGVGGSRI